MNFRNVIRTIQPAAMIFAICAAPVLALVLGFSLASSKDEAVARNPVLTQASAIPMPRLRGTIEPAHHSATDQAELDKLIEGLILEEGAFQAINRENKADRLDVYRPDLPISY